MWLVCFFLVWVWPWIRQLYNDSVLWRQREMPRCERQLKMVPKKFNQIANIQDQNRKYFLRTSFWKLCSFFVASARFLMLCLSHTAGPPSVSTDLCNMHVMAIISKFNHEILTLQKRISSICTEKSLNEIDWKSIVTKYECFYKKNVTKYYLTWTFLTRKIHHTLVLGFLCG